MLIKYNIIGLKYIFFISIFVILSLPANSELSVEEIIKGRKALFSKNYSTAKRVQALASKGEFEKAKTLMIEMSENYKTLIEYFPDNSKEGFKTEALPIIWENKNEFNDLMTKSSNDMIKLTKIIETSDDIRGTIGKFMWSNCKACHSKFRAPHEFVKKEVRSFSFFPKELLYIAFLAFKSKRILFFIFVLIMQLAS